MNEAPPAKPRRGIGRTAATTAAALAATLLAYPGGTASAQTIDCDALGDNPAADGVTAALETAIACDVEVRLAAESSPYATVYVTPQWQIRYVGTASPEQANGDQGTVDSTLVEADGTLVQANNPWQVGLSHTDTTAPLLTAGAAALDWTGDQPVPTHTGATAEYGELAPGLTLTAEAGVSTTEFQFTVTDAAAWDALRSGFRVTSEIGSFGYYPGLYSVYMSWPQGSDYDIGALTPFKIRDADGDLATARVPQPRPSDGSINLYSPSTPLEELSFPLTVTTEWIIMSRRVSEWGAVTSASPKLPIYRGEAGLDEPYFTGAGTSADLVVGSYCDQLVDPECATSYEAAGYWKFEAPNSSDLSLGGADWLTYPIESATFSIDAAEGAACVAPDLYALESPDGYHAGHTWNHRETEGSLADDGECHETTAVYDVTGSVPNAYNINFGMLGSDETARFDGGSARIEIVRDIRGLGFTASPRTCGLNYSPRLMAYTSDTTPHYGGFTVESWNELTAGLELSWTATFRDAVTGVTALTTESRGVVLDAPNPRHDLDTPLADGRYEVVYTFESATRDFSHQTAPCTLVVDTSVPEVTSIEVEPGPHYVGDTANVEVSVADAGFPDGWNHLVLDCFNTAAFCGDSTDKKFLTDTAAVALPLSVWQTSVTSQFELSDRAGNQATTPSAFTLLATHDRYDFNGDRFQDMMAVRASDGNLLYYAGDGQGGFADPVSLGTGWGDKDIAMAGDLTGDGKADLLARDTKTGTLYTYPGNGTGGHGARIAIGTGWNAMGAFTSAGDFNADGKIDLYAIRKSDSKLYFYPGLGNGRFGPRMAVGTGWGVMDALVAAGDVDYDNDPDLLAHDSRTGQYYLYKGDGAGNVGSRVAIAASLDGSGSDRYRQIAAVGDQDGDGVNDLVAIDARTGELELHSLKANGSAVHLGETIASGWGGNRLAAVNEERPYDYNGDGATDVVARSNSGGTTYLYPGTGTGTHGTRISWGTALKDMTLIATAGDMNGDGFADVLARTSGGTLYLYPGTGSGALNTAARITVGTGWNAMGTITGGHDYDSDGKADLIAVNASTGVLYLYPGKGDGTFGAREQIGTGWNGMREITAAGDLDHDGRADMIAARVSDGCLYFYGGKGDGTFKPLVQIGCGWGGYDAVTAVGDFNRDGHADFLARRKSDGVLFLYPGNGAGGHGTRVQVGTGWNAMNIA
jgi:hypothetical protein